MFLADDAGEASYSCDVLNQSCGCHYFSSESHRFNENYGYKLDGASTILALAYSCHKMKQGLKVCVHWNRNRSVVPMQSLVRGWLCRIGYKHMLDKQKKDRIESNRCVSDSTNIQRSN